MKNDAPSLPRGDAELGAQIFESSPDCVKLLDANGHITAINHNGFCALEIDDISTIAGKPWKSLWPEQNHHDIDHALDCARDGQIGHFSASCPTAKGTMKWWDVSVTPVRSDGDVTSFFAVSRDVTETHMATVERERLMRELQTANETMADIFRQAPVFMCVLSGPEHVFEMVNHGYLQLVGDRDPVGMSVRQALPELEGQGFFELLGEVYKTGKPFYGNNLPVALKRTPDGPLDQRFVDFVYMALRDADGNVKSVLAHGVDQTERTLAETGLSNSRERLQKIISQAGAGLVEADDTERITLVNQKYCSMLGYTESELLGMPLLAVTAPDSIEATADAVRQLKIDGVSFVLDKQYRRKDGAFLWSTSSVNALQDATSAYSGLVAIVVDISESRKASEQLRNSKERYRTLFDSMDQGFCTIEMIYDSAGKPVDYLYLEVNARFEEHTGLTDAAGKTMRQLVPGMDDFWFDTYARVVATGAPVAVEHGVPQVGRWFDVYGTKIGGADSKRVAVFFRDTTKRKQQEKDLEEAARRKDDFLAMLAHELRNPLAPIGAAAELLTRAKTDPVRVQKASDIIGRQVKHMTGLIDDLLDVSRVTRGLVELAREPLPVTQIINDAIEQVTPLIHARRQHLSLHLSPDNMTVSGDRKRLIQVVANILNNAAKYTPEGGEISLTTSVRVDQVSIHVSDNGIGMTPQLAEHVFDLFAQAERTSDRSSGGLGLGLALVKSLVELHGGSVTCSSDGMNQGSTFYVTLPRLVQEVSDAQSPISNTTHARPAARLRVLIVDDNVDAAAMLAMLLEAEGHQVMVEHGSQRALERAKQAAPQVCLLDIGLPGMDGYQLAQHLRAQPETAHAMMIAVTGYGQEGDRANALGAGFDHHLVKPVDTSELAALLAPITNAS